MEIAIEFHAQDVSYVSHKKHCYQLQDTSECNIHINNLDNNFIDKGGHWYCGCRQHK